MPPYHPKEKRHLSAQHASDPKEKRHLSAQHASLLPWYTGLHASLLPWYTGLYASLGVYPYVYASLGVYPCVYASLLYNLGFGRLVAKETSIFLKVVNNFRRNRHNEARLRGFKPGLP